MEELAGPYAVVALVLGVGGVAKLGRPGPLAGARRRLGLPYSRLLVRVVGVAEMVVAAGALVTGARFFAALVGASYIAFALFVVAAMRNGTVRSCGCFGADDAPPGVVHLVVDLLAAAVAGAVLAHPPPDLVTVLGRQPLFGLPFVVLVGTSAYLAMAAQTLLPVVQARATTPDRGGAAA